MQLHLKQQMLKIKKILNERSMTGFSIQKQQF